MTNFKQLFESQLPVIDVRTPAEFGAGHLPNALNLPMFTNEERHHVGICYKQKGKDEAVKLGLEYVGPKLAQFVTEAENMIPTKKAAIYCWRGGMRSNSMAWLLRTAGFELEVIKGGYKAWRNEVLKQLTAQQNWFVLGGFTGTGKTEVLHELAYLGEQIIDLESIANHRGSAFGKTNESQPSTEHFENLLAEKLIALDAKKPVWIEDESKTIGSVYVHNQFREPLKAAPFALLEIDFMQRVELLVKQYGIVSKEELKENFLKISKKLDGAQLKKALEYIDFDQLPAAAEIALKYYDKTYQFGMDRLGRKPLITLENNDYQNTAKHLIAWSKTLK